MRKDYLAFFISLFLSRLADQILLFIVPLIVFQTTNSVSWAGLAFFCRVVAALSVRSRCAGRCVTNTPGPHPAHQPDLSRRGLRHCRSALHCVRRNLLGSHPFSTVRGTDHPGRHGPGGSDAAYLQALHLRQDPVLLTNRRPERAAYWGRWLRHCCSSSGHGTG